MAAKPLKVGKTGTGRGVGSPVGAGLRAACPGWLFDFSCLHWGHVHLSREWSGSWRPRRLEASGIFCVGV